MSAPFKALLVEGTSGAGKSTLIDGLIRRHVAGAPPRKIRSLVHLAQSHTYGPLALAEDSDTLRAKENVRHLDGIVKTLEWLHAGVQEHDKPWCFVVIDTLHLTHCVRPGVVQWTDVRGIDRRLAALGCRLLFLRVSPNAIWERGIQPRTQEQFLRVYAKKFGATHEEIHKYFVEEQASLEALFDQSTMPKLAIENDQPDQAAQVAYEFWTRPEESTRR